MKHLCAVILCLSLTACAGESDVAAMNTARLTAHCESEGKHFALISSSTAPSTVPLISQVTVTGHCL